MYKYKFIPNILPGQMSLYTDGVSESYPCYLCKNEKQTSHDLLLLFTKTNSLCFAFRANQDKILYGFFDNTPQ